MNVSFNQISASIRVPGPRFEINTGERPYQGQSRLLYIVPMLAAGTAIAGKPIRMPSNPTLAFGAGSIAAEVSILARRQASLFEMWALPIAEIGGGTKASQTVTVNSVPAAGSYPFWVFGQRRSVAVSASDTTTTLAAKIAAAAQATYFLPGTATAITPPVTAAGALAVATVTSRHNGVFTGTTSMVDFSLYDETSPLAAAVTVATVTAGTGTPDIAAALATVGDTGFDWIANVYDDATSIASLANFITARWDPMSMLYGIAVYARQGSYGTLAAAGAVMNDRARILVGQNDSPDAPWQILAQGAAELASWYDLGAALTEAQRLARPVSGRVLRDLHVPRSQGNAFISGERNSLYFDGVSPLTATADGKVTFERVITTYQVDDAGLEDINFLDINYPVIAVYSVRFLKNYVWAAHNGTSIADDTEPPAAGQSRPKDVRATFGHGLNKLRSEAHILENIDGMLSRLVVERSSDPVRMNCQVDFDMANPFHVLAVNAQASAQFQS